MFLSIIQILNQDRQSVKTGILKDIVSLDWSQADYLQKLEISSDFIPSIEGKKSRVQIQVRVLTNFY